MFDETKDILAIICGWVSTVMFIIFGFRFLTYIGSPPDQYFTTLDKVMECRDTNSQKVEELDAICGKIPQVSEFIKEEK